VGDDGDVANACTQKGILPDFGCYYYFTMPPEITMAIAEPSSRSSFTISNLRKNSDYGHHKNARVKGDTAQDGNIDSR
jgi:hypothetical protein